MFTNGDDSGKRTYRRTNDERGVSPVIGVVLMVAITVVLASTAAAFFFQFNQQTVEAPAAGFTFDYESGSSDVLEITHRSGDVLDSDNVYLQVSDASATGSDPNGEYASHSFSTGPSAGSEIRAGTKVVVSETDVPGTDLDLSDATVTIVWKSPAEQKTITLDSWES